MKRQDFTTSMTVDQSPREAFDAIRNVRGWWSEGIEGSTAKVGDEFRYHYQNLHTCTMKLVEIVPGKRVAWLVTDNHFSFTEDKTEWKGTKVVFDDRERWRQDRDPLHARGPCPCLRVLQRLFRRLGLLHSWQFKEPDRNRQGLA